VFFQAHVMMIRNLIVCALLFVASAAAQSDPVHPGSNELDIWGGVSFKPVTAFSGITPAEAKGRKFVIVGLGYARRIGSKGSLSLQYTLDAIPLAIATNDILSFTPTPKPRGTAYGFGLVPLGLRLNVGRSAKVKPFVNIGAGGMIFSKPVPLPDAGKFAYALEGGAGVRWFRSSGRGLFVGAKLHHLSNGNRSGSNRGLNQIVFYTGVSFPR
jgi:hypothetical protein